MTEIVDADVLQASSRPDPLPEGLKVGQPGAGQGAAAGAPRRREVADVSGETWTPGSRSFRTETRERMP